MKERIAFFHPSSELYGADKILLYIMKNFPDYEKVLILKEEGPLVDWVRKECPQVDIQIIPSLPVIAKKNLGLKGIGQFLASLWAFRKAIQKLFGANKEHFRIIYLNTLAVLPVFFFFKKPVKIVHVHEILKNNNPLHRLINRTAVRKADALISVSHAVSTNLSEVAPSGMRDKIKVVHNGIKFDSQKTGDHSTFRVDKQFVNFALIGRIKPTHKGQNLLLEAIALLSPAHLAQSHFYLIGSTVPGQEYMETIVTDKINELGFNEKVTLIPFMEKIDRAYRAMDVIVVPSVFEDPFPTTVLEAMYWKKPVIATRVGGVPEMIVDGETGWLVNKNDAHDLASKISQLIDNPEAMAQMGSRGRAHFEKQFSEESFFLNYKACLKSILLK